MERPRIPVVIHHHLAVLGGRRRWCVELPETSLRNHGSAGGAVATPPRQYLAAPTPVTHSTGPTPHRVRHSSYTALVDRGTYTAPRPQHLEPSSAFEHERYDGLGVDALLTVCFWNTNVSMSWAWMLLSSSAVEHDRYYGLGMDGFIMGCT